MGGGGGGGGGGRQLKHSEKIIIVSDWIGLCQTALTPTLEAVRPEQCRLPLLTAVQEIHVAQVKLRGNKNCSVVEEGKSRGRE